MKWPARILFAAYTFVLLWLVLFKLSYDITGVLHIGIRSLNLIPFAPSAQSSMHETISNFVVFIPLGLLVGLNFKQVSLRAKLGFIFALSLCAEMLQYILAIGATDITDLITNTLGGLAGLGMYEVVKKYGHAKLWDWVIIVGGFILLALLLAMRVFVWRVRY